MKANMKRTSIKAITKSIEQSSLRTVKVNGINLTIEEFRRMRPSRRRFVGSRKKRVDE